MKSTWASFLIAITYFLFLASTVNAQVYKGQVLDEFTREPIPYVTVSIQNENNEHIRHTSTDENGYYLLNAPKPSNYYLHVKRIGYSENIGGPYFVETDDTLNVTFRVMEAAEELGEITVEGTSYEEVLTENFLKAKGFYKRMNQGIGQFMSNKDIEEKQANYMADLFRGMPGITTSFTRSGETIIASKRRTCPPKIVVNGHTMNFSAPLVLEGTGQVGSPLVIDHYASLENLVGVEVYPGLIGQPAEFGPKSYCGAIVLWTR